MISWQCEAACPRVRTGRPASSRPRYRLSTTDSIVACMLDGTFAKKS